MNKKYTYPLSLGISLVVLLIVTGLFIKQYLSIKNHDTFRERHTKHSLIKIEKIQEWMTFEYINRSFNIPNEYLKNELTILTDTYPKITLRKAASLAGTNPDTFISMVRESILKYQAANQPTQK